MNKALKWLVAIVLAPILLFLILTLLLYFPPVQNWAVRQVASSASEKPHGDNLERVNLSFPLDLQLDGLKMLKPNDSIPQQKDTVADVKQLIAKVQLLPLLSNKVEIDELTFKQLKANTINFIGDLRIKGNLERLHLISHGIDLKGDSVRLNVAEIQGGWLDIALGDTVPEDTTKRKDAVAHQHRPAEPCKD